MKKILITTVLFGFLIMGVFAAITKGKKRKQQQPIATTQSFLISNRLASPHNPSNYTPVSSCTCGGTTKVCCIVTSEIYSSTDPNFPNKPKVNQAPVLGNISERINEVLIDPTKRDIPDANGNIVSLQP